MEPHEKREVILDFLRKCVNYADKSIERKISRSAESHEVENWKSYREFTAFSLSELESGKLDDWLVKEESEPIPHGSISVAKGFKSLELDNLSHVERRGLLARHVGPSPVFLVGTVSAEGVRNLAPMSSIGVLSNTPPLICMSLSSDRHGRARDTLSNVMGAEEGARVSIHSLEANIQNANDVEIAAKPVASEISEWDLVSGKLIDTEFGDLLSTSLATIHAKVVDVRELPEQSKAKLVIMRAVSITTPDQTGDVFTSKLVQVEDNVLSGCASKLDWKHELDW